MILLIDGNNLAARANFAEPNLKRTDGTPTGVVYISLRSIKTLIETFKPEKIIFAFDKGWSNWRLNIYPNYKANRKDIYKTPEEIEAKEKYINQIKRFQKYLDYLPFPKVVEKYVEADDIIGYILCQFIDKNKQEEIILISNDKDFYQFIPYGVKIYDGIQQCFIDENYINNKLGIPSNQYIFYKSMLGDKGDNIDSIKGFGEKAAVNVISSGPINKIEDIREITKNLSGKKYKDITNNFHIIERNYEIINLINNKALTEEQIVKIKEQINITPKFDLEGLKKMCLEDEIKWNEEFLNSFNI